MSATRRSFFKSLLGLAVAPAVVKAAPEAVGSQIIECSSSGIGYEEAWGIGLTFDQVCKEKLRHWANDMKNK